MYDDVITLGVGPLIHVDSIPCTTSGQIGHYGSNPVVLHRCSHYGHTCHDQIEDHIQDSYLDKVSQTYFLYFH
jgi:hypothetical protein